MSTKNYRHLKAPLPLPTYGAATISPFHLDTPTSYVGYKKNHLNLRAFLSMLIAAN